MGKVTHDDRTIVAALIGVPPGRRLRARGVKRTSSASLCARTLHLGAVHLVARGQARCELVEVDRTSSRLESEACHLTILIHGVQHAVLCCLAVHHAKLCRLEPYTQTGQSFASVCRMHTRVIMRNAVAVNHLHVLVPERRQLFTALGEHVVEVRRRAAVAGVQGIMCN